MSPVPPQTASDQDLGLSSADAEEFERLEAIVSGSRKKRPVKVFAALALVGVGLAFILYKGLTDASTFFLRADEAVRQVDTLGEKQFRLQGFVVDKSVVEAEKQVDFDVEVNGAVINVRYPGVPPELFRPNISVTIVGRFAPGQAARDPGTPPLFLGDEINVKHDENYIEKNRKTNRLEGAVDETTAE